jgi:signal transduction histidine kinase
MNSNNPQFDETDTRRLTPSAATTHVLILQDQQQQAHAIATSLTAAGLDMEWQWVGTELEFIVHLRQPVDVIIADAAAGQFTADQALESLQRQSLTIPLIVVCDRATVTDAVSWIKAGATNYVASQEIDQLAIAVKQAQQEYETVRQVEARDGSNRAEAAEAAEAAETAGTSEAARTTVTDPLDELFNLDAVEIATKLSRSEAQIQAIISQNADGIVVVDQHQIVRFINPAALELFGRSRMDMMGKAFGFPVVGGDYLEVDVRSRRGVTHVAQMRVAEIEWHGESAYLISLRDITALKQAEAERIELLEQAEAANRTKDQFLAVISHELRTPLNPILGWAGLLRRRTLSPEKTAIALETIERNARIQVQLIEDLLDVSRIVRGQLRLEVQTVNLEMVIDNAVSTLALAAEAKSIQVNCHCDATVCPVAGDVNRLQQIVWNLLSNAIKFTPEGGQVDIELTPDWDSHQAVIRVKDSGAGIEPQWLPQIFNYFQQADGSSTRRFGGLGLGLAIVRNLVDLHGGSVTAASPGVGQGAVFTVNLPMTAEKPQSSLPTPESDDDNVMLEGQQVLVVDDEEDQKELLAELFRLYGAEVTAVTSAKDAIAVVQNSPPDILLSDISMPGMNGCDMLGHIHGLLADQDHQMIAIAVTAFAREAERDQALAAGFQRHVAKPIDPGQLIQLIASMLN